MPIEILMPALSPTMTEGTLAKWLKEVGDKVTSGDVIAEIETDKATMEVEAVDEGVLGRILVASETQNVAVNTVIGVLLEDGETPDSLDIDFKTEQTSDFDRKKNEAEASSVQKRSSKSLKATPLAKREAIAQGLDIGAIQGTGSRGKVIRADVMALQNIDKLEATASSGLTSEQEKGASERIFVSPIARKIASESDVDLGLLRGSGPNGRIIMADVLKGPRHTEDMPSNAAALIGEELIPMSGMRKVIAERMVSSKSNVPHFYLTVDCEIDELLKLRAMMNEEFSSRDVKLSVNDFIIKACGRALIDVPDANVSFDGEGGVRKYQKADISVAVALENGLITPIIRNTDSKSLHEISKEMKVLADKARSGKLRPEEYQGGSFSISNLGMYGIKHFEAIINEPQGAILAVGAGEKRPVVRGNDLAVATVMSCTLSCDHRVIDGAVGAQLISAIKKYIEYPPFFLMS